MSERVREAEPGEFGTLLRRYRLSAGLTQAALAERAGLSVRGIADLERGARTRPYPGTIERLAKALQLGADQQARLSGAVQASRVGPGSDVVRRTDGHNLPISVTSFVGREQEVAEIVRLLDKARLLTLTGPGGVGKTRLALRASEARLGNFADGVWLAELASLADPGLVAQVLRSSRVWSAIFEAWRGGAALAGSSAGAMALCSHTLIRASWPNRFNRRPADALGVVPDTAVLPHYDTFGHRWIESAQRELAGVTLLGIDERSAVLWRDGGWFAAGPGAVTVIKGSQTTRFVSGARVTELQSPARILPA